MSSSSELLRWLTATDISGFPMDRVRDKGNQRPEPIKNVRWELVGNQFIYMFPVDPVTGEPLPYPPGGWQRSSEIVR